MTTLRAGLVGHPVAHSRSPEVFAAWCARRGVQGAYALVDVPPADLAATLARLWADGWHGFNVTIPHKVAVATLLGGRLEAVNCAVRGPAGWEGHETDGRGFVETLPAKPAGLRATLLGAGGAARSVARALEAAGATVTFCARTPPPAGRWVPWDRADPACDLLVNCTPLGMAGGPPADWSHLPWAALPADVLVADLVYEPEDTPLLAQARARGLRTHGGLPMLRRQGEIGYELWLGAARSAAARFA